MKKTLALVTALFMVFGLAACSGGSSGGSSSSAPAPGSSSTALDFPKRTIEMVCHSGTGGSGDMTMRTMAELMKQYVDVPINVINKPGGGGITSMVYVNEQPADGYTVYFVTPSHMILEAQGNSPISFMDSFVPLGNFQVDQIIFSIHTGNTKFQTFEGLIEYAKAHPGEVMMGGTQVGGLDDYTVNAFAKAAGIEVTYVPYDSQSEQKAALLGREIDVYMDKIVSVLGMLEIPEVKPIILLGEKRLDIPQFADLPCTVEKGVQFTQGSWRGFSIKKGTPQEIVDFYEDLIYKCYMSDAYREKAAVELSDIVPGYMSAADYGAYWEEQVAEFKEYFAQNK